MKSKVSTEEMVSKLKEKTKNIVFLPVYYGPLFLYIFEPVLYTKENEIYPEAVSDFKSITEEFAKKIETKKKKIHLTTNGKYVQIRTKGTGDKNKTGKEKTFGYYFMKSFLEKIIKLPNEIPIRTPQNTININTDRGTYVWELNQNQYRV